MEFRIEQSNSTSKKARQNTDFNYNGQTKVTLDRVINDFRLDVSTYPISVPLMHARLQDFEDKKKVKKILKNNRDAARRSQRKEVVWFLG